MLAVLLAVALPETRAARTESVGFRGDVGSLLKNRAFVGYVLCQVLASQIIFAFAGGGPYIVVTQMGRTTAEYGAWFAATGFAGLKFLRQSQQHMDEIYIDVYGGYATKLLRLQIDMIQALDRHQRGNKQTVEVRHVHIHSGAQGVVGIVNAPEKPEGGDQK